MPPKKQKGTAKVKKRLVPLDEIDTTVLSTETLQEFCIDLHNALTQEKQYSESLKLDRDKLACMTAISKEQLIDLMNVIRANHQKLRECEHNHWKDMEEKRQKLIHLAFEKNVDCLIPKTSFSLNKANEPKCNEMCIKNLESEILSLKTQIRDCELKFAKEKTMWQINLAKEKCKIEQNNKDIHLIMEIKRENIINDKNRRLKKKLQDEYDTAEKIKNKAITQLIKHNKSFINDLKHYYNKIVHHNLSVIYSMKSNYEEIKADNAVVSKQLSQLNHKNQYLVHNLAKSQFEEKELQEKLTSSKRDQSELKHTKKDLANNNIDLDHMRWELEALNMRMEKQVDKIKEKANEEQSLLITTKSNQEQYILLLEYIIRHLSQKIYKLEYFLKSDKWDLMSKSQDEVMYYMATVAQDRTNMYSLYREQLDRHGVHIDNTGFQIYNINQIIKDAECLKVIVDKKENVL